jgi:hydrogenase maturation protein HypF
VRSRIGGCVVSVPAPVRAAVSISTRGIADTLVSLCSLEDTDDVVLSGGVFQNELLVRELVACLSQTSIRLSMNRIVPPNDVGISLGQAAMVIGAAGK